MSGTPKTKTRETAALWEMSPSRQIAQAVTFLAGGKRTVLDPNGRESINTWKAPERSTAPGDPSFFLEHVGYLFGAESDRFIDWLAHIEQQPGELPQFGWLHISDKQGTGRNWIASIIARLWTGYAAVNFNLAGMFKTGFNDRLSRKLIAVVDEIDQGASTSKHDDAQKLKSLVNEGQRTINPKFGRIREEWLKSGRTRADSDHAVAFGLASTGRVITAAALLMAIVFGAMISSQVSFMRMFGLGLTIAVLMDATMIRMLLVPAFMRLAGRFNWWAPAPLRKLHDKIGLSES